MLSSLPSRLRFSSATLFSRAQYLLSSKSISTTCPSPNFTEETIAKTLSCYSNEHKRALDFFKWAESECGFQHTTSTYNAVIDILGKFFEFEESLNLIKAMQRSPISYPDYVTFRIMFKRYALAHQVNEAIDMFNGLEKFNLKDEVSFSNLIDALCEYKHVLEAEELCLGKNSRLAFDFRISTKFYNLILRGWFKMGWWRKCRDFWEEMDRKGVEKDLHSYSIYMDVMCKSGKPWKAVKLFKEMKKKRIKVDAVAYNTAIRAVGMSEGVDSSFRLYREMVEMCCEPNINTYNTIIKLLCQNGRVKEAYEVFYKMPNGCMPNVITYHYFFGCLEKPGEILKMFDRMIESGLRPRMDTYVMLMRKFGRWGFLRPIFIVWNKMEEHGCSPDEFAYIALIDALVEKGEIDMARKYDNEMLAKGLSAKPRVQSPSSKLSDAEYGEGS